MRNIVQCFFFSPKNKNLMSKESSHHECDEGKRPTCRKNFRTQRHFTVSEHLEAQSIVVIKWWNATIFSYKVPYPSFKQIPCIIYGTDGSCSSTPCTLNINRYIRNCFKWLKRHYNFHIFRTHGKPKTFNLPSYHFKLKPITFSNNKCSRAKLKLPMQVSCGWPEIQSCKTFWYWLFHCLFPRTTPSYHCFNSSDFIQV